MPWCPVIESVNQITLLAFPEGKVTWETIMINNNKTAMVVDDSTAMQLAVGVILEEIGYEYVLQAEDGLAAFDLLRRCATPPDLMVIDWHMPFCDGGELLEMIRREPKFSDVTLIVMSSSPDHCNPETVYKLGADSFLVKPFKAECLHASLEQARLRAATRRDQNCA